MKLFKLPILFSLVLTVFMSTNANAQCPAITANPQNVTVCVGVTSTFTVAASGTGLTYQWQQYDMSTWSNINSAPYSGYNTPTLTISGSPLPLGGFSYRCIVSKTSCSSVTSNAATLTLNTEPSVDVSPHDSIICLGTNVTFEVIASGSGLTYQWYADNGSGWSAVSNLPPYSGATTQKLLLSNPPISMNGSRFAVTVGGTCPSTGNNQSDTADLVMLNLPIVTSEPQNAAACIGTDVTFATAATGTNVAFQWQGDDGTGFVDLPGTLPYAGVYSNKLDIQGIGVTAAKNGWKFRCVVSGTCSPSDTTNVVTLTVKAAPSISSVSKVDTLCAGDDAEIDIVATGSGLKYRWSVDSGTGFFQVVDGGVYSGSQTDKLKLTAVPSNFDGNVYRCFIEGDCPISKYSAAVDLWVREDKLVTGNPRDTTVNVGIPAEFNAEVKGTNLQVIWQWNDGGGFQNIGIGSPYYSGQTTTKLTVKNPTREMQGYTYRCLVYGGCDKSPIATTPAVLNVWWPASVSELTKDNSIVAYPNPTNAATLNLLFNDSKYSNLNAKVVDQFGRTLISKDIAITDQKGELNISTIPTGVYSLFLTNEQFNIVKTIKFTKL